MNIRLIVTAMEDALGAELVAGTGVDTLHIATVNYQAPSIPRIEEYLSRAEECIMKGHGVAVHCGGGKGRAGTLLTSFLIKHGLKGPSQESGWKMGCEESISFLRHVRPGSIETSVQE